MVAAAVVALAALERRGLAAVASEAAPLLSLEAWLEVSSAALGSSLVV